MGRTFANVGISESVENMPRFPDLLLDVDLLCERQIKVFARVRMPSDKFQRESLRLAQHTAL